MGEIKSVYSVEASKKTVDNVIYEEIYKTSNFWESNLSGDRISTKSVNIYNRVSFITFSGGLGPLVKLNVRVEEDKTSDARSILTFARLNGITYTIQFWCLICFIILTLAIAAYLYLEGNSEYIFLFPGFALFCLMFVELIASVQISELMGKVKNILNVKGIIYTKEAA